MENPAQTEGMEATEAPVAVPVVEEPEETAEHMVAVAELVTEAAEETAEHMEAAVAVLCLEGLEAAEHMEETVGLKKQQDRKEHLLQTIGLTHCFSLENR